MCVSIVNGAIKIQLCSDLKFLYLKNAFQNLRSAEIQRGKSFYKRKTVYSMKILHQKPFFVVARFTCFQLINRNVIRLWNTFAGCCY